MTTEPRANAIFPCEPPFAYIDEVLVCDDQHAVSARTFGASENFFRGHFPGHPVVPGVVLIEAMAQTLAYFGMSQNDAKVTIKGIERARFRKPVLPGDRVTFEVRIVDSSTGKVRARAEAKVDDTRVADVYLIATFDVA